MFSSRIKTIGVVLILVLPIAILLLRNWSPQSGFLTTINFGQNWVGKALPEVQQLNPPAKSEWGYDGQFYAQLSLNPVLSRSDLKPALDNPTYRARRIGLPLLASFLGFGQPAFTLQVYAVLNFIFWLILLAGLIHFVGLEHPRDILLAMSLLWTAGTIVSIERALTDLPATVMGMLAVRVANHYKAASSLAGAALMRETCVLSAITVVWPEKINKKVLSQVLVAGIIILLPLVLWLFYAHYKLGSPNMGQNNFDYPLAALGHKLHDAFLQLKSINPRRHFKWLIFPLFELLAPISVFIQSVYLVVKPKFLSKAWRMGIGFALLFYFLGDAVMVEQFAFTRAILPMTIAFNLLLHEFEKNRSYAIWYALGNLGMMGMLLMVLFH